MFEIREKRAPIKANFAIRFSDIVYKVLLFRENELKDCVCMFTHERVYLLATNSCMYKCTYMCTTHTWGGDREGEIGGKNQLIF